MTLCLVIYQADAAKLPAELPPGEARAATPWAPAVTTPPQLMRAIVRDAVWEVADAHWALGEDSILVSTDLSPDYLLTHFRRALKRHGMSDPGLLLVTSVGPKAAWTGLPAEAEGWLKDALA